MVGIVPVHFSQNIFIDHNKIDTGSTHIFLRAGIDQVKFIEIKLAAQYITAHICYQRHAAFIRNVVPLCTGNRFIGGDVQISWQFETRQDF